MRVGVEARRSRWCVQLFRAGRTDVAKRAEVLLDDSFGQPR
jgi:hypothetical protein